MPYDLLIFPSLVVILLGAVMYLLARIDELQRELEAERRFSFSSDEGFKIEEEPANDRL